MPAKDLWAGYMPKIKEFEAWAKKQKTFRFYQASLLFMFEGEATNVADAKLSVSYVDFAHCFNSLGESDENLSKAVTSLIGIIEKAVGL